MPRQPKSKTRSAPTQKKKLRFNFIKSSSFRVVHADGAWGGITPHGNIQVAFFSERTPIPQQIVHELTETGLGPEIKEERVARDGVVREVEVSVQMNLDIAKSVHDWLGKKIENAEKIEALVRKGKK